MDLRFPAIAVAVGLALAAPSRGAAQAEMTSEPHHHLVLENAYVRVFDVHVAAHDATQLHWHHHDDFWIGLGRAVLANDVTGKPEVTLASTDGGVHFSRGGYTHVVRNLGRAPFHNLTVELERPQGAAANLCGNVILPGAPMGAQCPAAPGITPLFQTAATGLFRIQIPVGGALDGAGMGKGSYLLVALDPLRAGNVVMRAGQFLWIDGALPAFAAGPQRARPSRLLVFRFS